MSRVKSFLETEVTPQPKGQSGSPRQNQKRKSAPPTGHFAYAAKEAPSLNDLIRQMQVRLRRTWVSTRYQFHRVTLGVFKNQVAVKFGGLALCGYLFLGTNAPLSNLLTDPGAFFFGDHDRTSAVAPLERGDTQLEIGGGGTSKPVNWKENDAAPIGVGGLREEQAMDYVRRFSKIAQTEMEKFGIPASISLAQGLVESRAGTSTLARRNNNHFGMKCFSKRCAKGHCSNFTDDHHKDFFRIYKNAWESWRAHSEMLASGRYASLKKYENDYKKWAYGLKSIGYATDRQYAEKLIGMIERYELYKYDR